MKREVNAGVDFLRRLAHERGGVDETRAKRFADKLKDLLCEKYAHHWYPDNPSKGQAFRCIRIDSRGPSDEPVLKACADSELKPSELALPHELTLWIDPLDVCARKGEGCRYFTVAHFKEHSEEEEDSALRDGKGGADAAGDPDTSDYHSASSSDCGSAICSDAEEEGKERGGEGGTKEEEKKSVEKEGAAPFVIAMKPRLRQPREPKDPRKGKKSQAPSLQYFYSPAPMWPQYKKKGPVFLSTVCPPPATPFLGYYILPKPPPQFIMPQATLQPWGAVKG
ncbi:protein BTG3 [Conger conger]|uniref:protein BTG3 n=1 Tax=Conger conger TaxID=82655 RepID=UPI002A5AABCA|nr:protein BTG3 [Conger conger]